MPTTPAHALRYPAATDPADVPSDLQKLASDVDVALIPCDTVVAAATRVIRNLLLAGDANAAFQLRGDGRHDWGAGGANAADTNLYRSGVGALASDGEIHARQGAAGQIVLGSNAATPTIVFGSAADTNLSRIGVGWLASNGAFYAGGPLYSMQGDTSKQSSLGYTGGGQPTLYLGGALDAYMSREAAGRLVMQGTLRLQGQLWYDQAVSGAVGGGQPYKFPIWNGNGAFLGYVPIYTT